MINFDDVAKETIKEHNANFSQILDLPYRIFMIGGSIFDKNKEKA